MKKTKKVISVLLCAVLLFSLAPLALAEDALIYGACGENAAWEYDKNTETMTIKGSGEIEEHAFAENWGKPAERLRCAQAMKTLVIESGITTIGFDAFSGCTALTDAIIQDGVTDIEAYAFDGCTSLTNLVLPDSITYIGWDILRETPYCNSIDAWQDGALYIGNHLIKVDLGLTGDYEIRPGTKCIGYDADFGLCDGLKSVTIPDSVTSFSAGVYFGFVCMLGSPDSCAERYASEYGCLFVSLSPNFSVTLMDAETKLNRYTDLQFRITGSEPVEVCFESSNPRVASVNEIGEVEGKWLGTATITMTVTDRSGHTVSDTCTVNVKPLTFAELLRDLFNRVISLFFMASNTIVSFFRSLFRSLGL